VALRIRASFKSPKETIAEKGYVIGSCIFLLRT